jgi:hypothetical protein
MDQKTCAFIVYVAIMLVFGALGGWLNYLRERKEDSDNSSTNCSWTMHVLMGVIAAFLVPLFLKIIQSDLVNAIELDFANILVFIGFCLLASITSQRFINTLAERFLQNELKKVENKVADSEQKLINDAKALKITEQVLEDDVDLDVKLPEEKKIIETIKHASVYIRAQIFRKARDFRVKYSKSKPEILYRAIALFEGLIKSDTDDKYHRNHAQLAYLLKDKPNPDFKKAEHRLTKAIELRNKALHPTTFKSYEYNRAICRINSDVDFNNNKATKNELRDVILIDLKEAQRQGRWQDIVIKSFKNENEEDQSLFNWFKINQVKQDEVFITN